MCKYTSYAYLLAVEKKSGALHVTFECDENDVKSL